MKKIITHNGRAHLDDFLACCFLIAKFPNTPIFRVDNPTEEELSDPDVWVVDKGRDYNTELKNFDHHQMKGGCVCALSLVLDYFGMRNYDAFPWLKKVETWDHCGPKATFELFGSQGGDPGLFYSPIEDYLIDIFSKNTEVHLCDSFYDLMSGIGEKIINDWNSFIEWMDDLNNKVGFFRQGEYTIADCRETNQEKRNIAAENLFFNKKDVDIILNHDLRNEGFLRMVRRNDDIDFNKAKEILGIKFIHQNGFLITFENEMMIPNIVETLG